MDSDEALLKKIAKGHEKAFATLFEKYKGHVYGLSLKLLGAKMLAEENSQEIWIKVIKKADSFQPSGSVKSWILTMTKNQALNVLRKRGWESDLSPEMEAQLEWDDSSLEEELAHVKNLEKLKSSIDQLPERQRVALVLYLTEKPSYEEMAQQLETSVSTVKSLLFRARENLKKEWGE